MRLRIVIKIIRPIRLIFGVQSCIVACPMRVCALVLHIVPLTWRDKSFPLDEVLAAVWGLLVFKGDLLSHALTVLSLCRSHKTGTA